MAQQVTQWESTTTRSNRRRDVSLSFDDAMQPSWLIVDGSHIDVVSHVDVTMVVVEKTDVLCQRKCLSTRITASRLPVPLAQTRSLVGG